MPHVIVKLWPGKSEQQKRRLAQAITDDVTKVLHYGQESVSVAFEEIDVAGAGDHDQFLRFAGAPVRVLAELA